MTAPDILELWAVGLAWVGLVAWVFFERKRRAT